MRKTTLLILLIFVRLSAAAQDSFFFWTDSHFPRNAGKLPEMIRDARSEEPTDKAFYGGDVTLNVQSDEFRAAMDSFFVEMSHLHPMVKLYLLRGNHDFYTKKDFGCTLDDAQTARRLASAMNGRVVRNGADRNSNYWYFDNRKARIRYIGMDTTDSVVDSKVNFGVGDTQLRWIFTKAMLGTPPGYGVVMLFHVPVSSDHKVGLKVSGEVCRAIEAFASGRDFEWKGERIPFSNLRDVRLLYVQNGHRHFDYAQYHNGVLHVITSADTKGFESGTNVFDRVRIDKDFSRIDMQRFGQGNDRRFNLVPIVLRKGESVRLESDVKGIWSVRDGCGNVYSKKLDGGRGKGWIFSTKIASVGGDGTVTGLEAGDAMACVQAPGKEEYFLLIVK